MEVILKKNVDKLGYKDEVVTVKNGFGRNFLIPQGYASLATESAKKAHAEIMRQKSHKESQIKEAAEAIAAKLDGLTVKVVDTIIASTLDSSDTSNILEFEYESQIPYKTLPSKEITRVYDKIPVKALLNA